eukprot:132187-Karenia_brevis.AAC.1
MEEDVRSPPSFFSVASSPHAKSAPVTPPKSGGPAPTPGWDANWSRSVRELYVEHFATEHPEEARRLHEWT